MAGKTAFVTGGAGYIGSHTCLALKRAGYEVVVYDSLLNGHQAFVRWGPLEEGDVRDRERLSAALARHRPAVVIHFAALIEAGVSVRDPAPFYDVNVGGVLSLLAALRDNCAPPLVFSSTCATYGMPDGALDEAHPQRPINPYGWTKFYAERAIDDHCAAYGMRAIKLRYFNAAGAAPEERLGERHEPETHAIPLAVFAGLGRRPSFSLFGDDYETRDGSAVRDYVHVLDLADAHVRAAQSLIEGGESDAFNLGTGTGTTVKELVAAVERAAGKPIPLVRAPRRLGDPPALVASADKASRTLGWRPTRTIDDIVGSAWRWHAEVERTVFN